MPIKKVDFSDELLEVVEVHAARLGMSVATYVKHVCAVATGASFGPNPAFVRPLCEPSPAPSPAADGPDLAPIRPQSGPKAAPFQPAGGTIGGESVPLPTSTPPEDNTPPPPSSGGFARFWEAYPRKVGKRAAEKAWKRTARDRPSADEVVAAVERARRSAGWTRERGQFIPNPATWLNQGRWEDELSPPPDRSLPKVEVVEGEGGGLFVYRDGALLPPDEAAPYLTEHRRPS